LTRDTQDWEELARLDPLWAVLSEPERKHNRWRLDEFLATGDAEVSSALARITALREHMRFERALDLGCGVGRATRALAERFRQCVGIDVAQTMIRHAAKINADRRNCSFSCFDATNLERFDAGRFDLVWSVLMLQHLRRADVEGVISSMGSVLEVGGVAIFQLPHSIRAVNRLQVSRRLYRALRQSGASSELLLRRLPLTPMRMTALSEQRVAYALRLGGCELLAVEPYGDQRRPTPGRLYFAQRID
jgi:SAM-dependent methyltransferase